MCLQPVTPMAGPWMANKAPLLLQARGISLGTLPGPLQHGNPRVPGFVVAQSSKSNNFQKPRQKLQDLCHPASEVPGSGDFNHILLM